MPNGGSDCCGTCWFNTKNKGEAGYEHSRGPDPDFCRIRQISIQDPFYTYCANHPHRMPGKVQIPVGSVYKGDSQGNRQVLVPLPDTPENRFIHLKLLEQIREGLREEYPIGIPAPVAIIEQLTEWGEVRAIPDLEIIAAVGIAGGEPEFHELTNVRTVLAARSALERLKK
jgi:hypothetical protein